MLLFFYYVPVTHLTEVNTALFALGLGRYLNYDSCCWYTKGQGQFRPLANSNPTIGQIGELETVEEYKVELICPNNLKEQVINVLKNTHPYETPAYGFIELN